MDPEDVTELTQEETTELLLKAWKAHENLLDMLGTAWGIIANVDWNAATNSPGWREAATRWRDEYHELLREETLPEVENPLLERMAGEVHQIWCNWMEYMFKQGSPILGNESWIMSKFSKRRWSRQMITPYAQLSEEEKMTNREIARRYLNIALQKELKDITRSLNTEELWDLVKKEKEND